MNRQQLQSGHRLPPEAVAATRLQVARWCLSLPVPDGRAGDTIARLHRHLPEWVAGGCRGAYPVGLATVLAACGGISAPYASQILNGLRPLPLDSEWARKLFS